MSVVSPTAERMTATALLVIDDRILVQKLQREGGRLREAGKLTSGDELRKQLRALQKQPNGQAVQGLSPAPNGARAVRDLYAVSRRGTLIIGMLDKDQRSAKITAQTAAAFVVTSSRATVTTHDGRVVPITRRQ